MVQEFIKNWWNLLRYEPDDPRLYAGGTVRIAAIGGGTGLSTLLRGLKKYSNHISAIVTVADNGSSTGDIRKEFDMLAPGDIRKCIGALAYDEEIISQIFEHRFSKDKQLFGGHTLGNIWITGLTQIYGSFDKAIEATSEIFKTAGKVLPATLSEVDIKITYKDNSEKIGECYLDEILKPISKVALTDMKVRAYVKAVEAINTADLILIGPGSLYGSVLPNLLIPDLKKAIVANKKATKIYIANCSNERTQTPGYTVEDHIDALIDHAGRLFDLCLVNNKILRRSDDQSKLGEINNIVTEKSSHRGVQLVKEDVISEVNPLFHDSVKLARAIIELYNRNRKK